MELFSIVRIDNKFSIEIFSSSEIKFSFHSAYSSLEQRPIVKVLQFSALDFASSNYCSSSSTKFVDIYHCSNKHGDCYSAICFETFSLE